MSHGVLSLIFVLLEFKRVIIQIGVVSVWFTEFLSHFDYQFKRIFTDKLFVLLQSTMIQFKQKIILEMHSHNYNLVFISYRYFIEIKLNLINIHNIIFDRLKENSNTQSIQQQLMFQNSYQNGTYFDMFDPKVSQDKVKNLYKISNVHGNNKIFDKQLKTYVMEFSGTTSRISFPKEQKKDLYLIQQFLVFQIFFFPQMSWNIQLVISDLTKTKRRIILSSTTNKVEIKPFFVKMPCITTKQGIWNTLGVDLFSYIQAFKGQTYRSLDAIYITGHFKLRRIYTSNTRPIEDQYMSQQVEKSQVSLQTFHQCSLPKNFYYPPQIPYTTKVVSYQTGVMEIQQLYEPTEPSTKNSSKVNILKRNENKFSTPKTNVVKSQKFVNDNRQNVLEQTRQKKFLANTNGPQIVKRKKNFERQDSSEQSQTEKSMKTPGSVEKGIKRKNLTKTQIAHKMKSSIEKKKEDKTKTKAKLNPWRTNVKDVQTDGSQLEISKHEQRSVESAQTTLFKTKNNLASKFNQSKNRGFDRKSDHYSDSQYVELSQKFSTLTDGKFFKNELSNQQQENHEHNDQIEENIEMQTNSMYQSKKQESPYRLQNQEIVQSICDSLDKKQSPYKMGKNRDISEFEFRNSHYGFGQNLMKQFMGQIQRPYSPPLGERDTLQEDEEIDRKKQAYSPQKQEVELIYDPVLNCYYDHKTHTYYELKN